MRIGCYNCPKLRVVLDRAYFLLTRKQPIIIVIITASARRTIAVRGQVGVEPQGKQRISIYLLRLNLKLKR